MKTLFSVATALALVATPMLAKDPSHGGGDKNQHSKVTATKKTGQTSSQVTQTSSSTSNGTSGQTKTAKKAVISQGVLNGKAISKPHPAYPPIAR